MGPSGNFTCLCQTRSASTFRWKTPPHCVPYSRRGFAFCSRSRFIGSAEPAALCAGTGQRRATTARLVSAVLAMSLLVTGCHSGLPKPQSAQYTQFVRAFYVGLAAMEVGNDVRAETELAQATQLAPGEPAAWADWVSSRSRQRNFDPQSGAWTAPRASPRTIVEKSMRTSVSSKARAGNSAEASANLRKAVDLDPRTSAPSICSRSNQTAGRPQQRSRISAAHRKDSIRSAR